MQERQFTNNPIAGVQQRCKWSYNMSKKAADGGVFAPGWVEDGKLGEGCSGHGDCVTTATSFGQCECDEGWSGKNCETKATSGKVASDRGAPPAWCGWMDPSLLPPMGLAAPLHVSDNYCAENPPSGWDGRCVLDLSSGPIEDIYSNFKKNYIFNMDCTAITPEGCNKVKGGKGASTGGTTTTGCIWAGDGPGVAAVYTNANIKKIRSSACNWPYGAGVLSCVDGDSVGDCQIDGDQPPCPGCWGWGGILPSGYGMDVSGWQRSLSQIPPSGLTASGRTMYTMVDDECTGTWACCCEGLTFGATEHCDTTKCKYKDRYLYDPSSGRLSTGFGEADLQPPYPCGPGLVCDLNGQCTKDTTNAIGPCAPNPCKNNEVCFAKGARCHDAKSCKAAAAAGARTHICVGPGKGISPCDGIEIEPLDNKNFRNSYDSVLETDSRAGASSTWCRVPCTTDMCGTCPSDRTDCIQSPGGGAQIQPYYWASLTQPLAYALSLPVTCVDPRDPRDRLPDMIVPWVCTNSNGTNLTVGSNVDANGVVLPDYIPFILNGGSTNGGSTNGGSTNGGSTNGGSTNGGSTNGGGSGNGSGGTDACTSNPCQNNGACKSTSTGYICHCTSQFTGDKCETPVQNGKQPSLTPATFNPATDIPVSVVDCQQKIARIIGNSSNYVLTRDPPYTCPNQKITVSVS